MKNKITKDASGVRFYRGFKINESFNGSTRSGKCQTRQGWNVFGKYHFLKTLTEVKSEIDSVYKWKDATAESSIQERFIESAIRSFNEYKIK